LLEGTKVNEVIMKAVPVPSFEFGTFLTRNTTTEIWVD